MATTVVFLLEEFHGQRSLVGYSPWGSRKLDTTGRLTLHFMMLTVGLSYMLLLCWSLFLYTHFAESFYHNWMMLNFVKGCFSTYWDDRMISIFHFGKILLLRMNIVDEKRFANLLGSLAWQHSHLRGIVIKSQCSYLYWTSHTFKIILYELSNLQAH